MWASKNRTRYDRDKMRYPSDLTNDEWELVEPLIPPGRSHQQCELLHAIAADNLDRAAE